MENHHYRLGLIRARLAGARLARGDVLVFLDAHCEANNGYDIFSVSLKKNISSFAPDLCLIELFHCCRWIEPLLARIKESHKSVLVPIIDVIDAKDFHYSINGYKSFQVIVTLIFDFNFPYM